MAHKFTPEQRDFILQNLVGVGNQDLADRFNAHFGLSVTKQQIKQYKRNHKLSSGLTGRYERGHVPANKGQKMSPDVYAKAKATMFQKGHTPANHRPVGSERIDRDGYCYVKIAEPNKWRMKHVLEWERFNGPVPRGYKLLFADQNKRNTSIDNLILVSAAQMAVVNHMHMLTGDKDCNKSSLILANLLTAVSNRSKKKK